MWHLLYIYRVDSHGLPVEEVLDGSDNSDKVRIQDFQVLGTLHHSIHSITVYEAYCID